MERSSMTNTPVTLRLPPETSPIWRRVAPSGTVINSWRSVKLEEAMSLSQPSLDPVTV